MFGTYMLFYFRRLYIKRWKNWKQAADIVLPFLFGVTFSIFLLTLLGFVLKNHFLVAALNHDFPLGIIGGVVGIPLMFIGSYFVTKNVKGTSFQEKKRAFKNTQKIPFYLIKASLILPLILLLLSTFLLILQK